MAIHVYTGVPGSGKTLHAVDDIEHLEAYRDRQVYAHAIDDWERAIPIACLHPGCRSCRKLTPEQKGGMLKVEQWQDWVETGALLVVDEAQYAFPQRREKETPQYIVRLTEHRHDGVDFILMSPNINMIDINVRRLVERHVHHLIAWNGKFQIVHNEAMESEKELKAGLSERWVWPTRSFGKYRSSDMHVKLSKPIPRIYIFLAASVVLAVLAGGGLVYRSKSQRTEALARASELAEAARPVPVVEERNSLIVRESGTERGEFFSNPVNLSKVPRIPWVPESAPIYDRVELPEIEAPRLAGCASSPRRGCKCYTQRGLEYRVPEQTCRALINGVPADLTTYGAGYSVADE